MIRLTGTQRELMEILWENGHMTLHALTKATLGNAVTPNRTDAIRVVLLQMVTKGAVSEDATVSPHIYTPIVERDEVGFESGFVDVARMYRKKYGRDVPIVPVYIAPKLRKIYIGKGISYDNENRMEAERSRICEYLSAEITDFARSLPLHTVVPYRNIPKKYYLTNKDITEVPNEKTRG